jgi:hypothetical protein
LTASEIRGERAGKLPPDFAALNPGYVQRALRF